MTVFPLASSLHSSLINPIYWYRCMIISTVYYLLYNSITNFSVDCASLVDKKDNILL